MKLPEPLFAIINPIVGLLLRSPVHGFWSKSLMLITFTGRRSGRRFTTPVRYVVVDDVVRCYTSSKNLWWRNLIGGVSVDLLIGGGWAAYRTDVIVNDPAAVKLALQHYLAIYPQDSAYHEIRLNRDKTLNEQDLDRAALEAVVVEARRR